MYGLKAAAEGMAGLSEALGMVVNAVRAGVRALISFLVGRIISWAIEEAASLGVATPVVMAQATAAVEQTAFQITRIVKDLMASLRNLNMALQAFKYQITALRVGTSVRAGGYAYQPYGG